MPISDADYEELLNSGDNLIKAHLKDKNKTFLDFKKTRDPYLSDSMTEHCLNTNDVLVISGYADYLASYLNGHLRQKKASENKPYDLYILRLSEALSVMKSYSNKTVYVSYTCIDEQKILQWFHARIGKVVEFPNFLGSSQELWTSNSCIKIKILTSSDSCGKLIAPLTGKRDYEKEVLFMTNAKFRIEDFNIHDHVINFYEVDHETKSDHLLKEGYYLN